MLKGTLNIDNRVYGGMQCIILATKKLILQWKTNRVCKPKKKKQISDVADDVAQQKCSNNNCYASAFRYIQICKEHKNLLQF